MNSSDCDEVVPLLERRRNKLTKKYKSLTSHSEMPEKDSRSPKNLEFESEKNNSNRKLMNYKITYAWNNMNVYGSSDIRNSRIRERFPFWMSRTGCSAENGKHILKNMKGVALPGEILAVMGPSGAGKSTLLNALTFQTNNKVTGSRYLNGQPIESRNVLASVSAYVEQNPLFYGTLTVREHLIFHASIRMDRRISYNEKVKRVDDVIDELGLEKCKNTIIGFLGKSKGISDGEMKRLSFASEVLTNPPVMFCDEPTSGLDSFAALNVTKILKAMATAGKTVICIIHQPSSDMFSLFDKILLLAEGRTAFLGSSKQATIFLAELGIPPLVHHSLPDIFIGLLSVLPKEEKASKETINFVCDSFEQSNYQMELDSKIIYAERGGLSLATALSNCNSYFKVTWCTQFRVLFWRSWLNIRMEPLLVKVRLFQAAVLSLIIGLIYQHQEMNENGVVNINGVLFTFLTNMTFQNIFAVITVFCGELPIFMKEHDNKMYRVDVYFLSKTLAEIPLFFLIPTIFTAITYYWIGLNPGIKNFFSSILIMILVTNAATSFGYLISSICPNVLMALSVGPPVIIPFLLFGGFLLNIRAIPNYFKWLSYLSWFKYGNEALLINQWSDIEEIVCVKQNVTCPKNGDVVLKMYNFRKENFYSDLYLLGFLILLFRLLAYTALVIRTIFRRNIY